MKKRVLMVMTRDIPPEASNGRERTLRFIRDAIGAKVVLEEFKIRSAFETGGLLPKLHALWRLAKGLLSGQPCALQVAMFANPAKADELLAAIGTFRPDVIYLDGIRLVDYAALIHRKAPGRQVIVDFDDLMSRRAEILHDAQLPLSAGYLAKSIPGPVVRLANSRLLRRLFLRYESVALRRHEREAVRVANAVTLVSTADAAALTSRSMRLRRARYR
jgi:hypothetical protein